MAAAFFAAATVRADETTYLYGGPGGAYTPGHAIPVVYGTNAATVAVAIYALPLDVAAAYLADAESVQGDAIVGKRRVIATLTATARSKTESGTRSAEIPVLPLGYYAAIATAGTQTRTAIFDITTLGLISNNLGEAYSFFAVDLRTYARHLGPTSLEIVGSAANGRRRFDATGLAEARVSLKSAASTAIARTGDGSAIAMRLSNYAAFDGSAGPSDVGFIQTDRPIYRPGQSVYVRAIVRTGSIGSYRIPSGSRSVKVTAPDGTNVYRHPATISSFGTLNATVRLPDDTPVGYYQIAVGVLESSVTVEAYKKPEYEMTLTPAAKYIVGGETASFAVDAKYFFGRPAAGLKLHYRADRQRWIFPWYYNPYSRFEAETYAGDQNGTIAQGDLETDAAGRATIAFPTKTFNYEENINLQVDGRDGSGRTVSVTAGVLLVPASFYINLAPAQWFAQQGQPEVINVSTRDYGEKVRPNIPVSVEIVGRRWDAKQNEQIEIAHEMRSVMTDAAGKISFTWTPRAAGSYSFAATSKDEAGRTARGSLYLWVLGAGETSWLAPIEEPIIIAQQQTYKPGERPRVLLSLPKPGRDALVLIATDSLISTRVVHVTGQAIALNLDAAKGAAQFTVTVQLPNENGVSTANATIRIEPSTPSLNISIKPRKARYAPGERAQVDIHVTDWRGSPARADLGIGVVDKAIYALQAANTTTPLDAFYGQVEYPYPMYSWFRPNIAGVMAAPEGLARTAADVYSVAHVTSRIGTLRTNFQDTAYWAPSVVTDANGNATIAFTWPDNLTTWRATGVAVTQATQVGQASGDALVTKDFLVRLQTPRFLRAGDTSTIVGIAQGQSSHQSVSLKLEAPNLPGFPQTASVKLDAYQSSSASWPISAPGTGSTLLTLSGSDGVLSDAMQLPLPLLAGTAAEHVRVAGQLPVNASLTVTIPPGYLGGDVHLSLSPSIVAELVQNVRLLNVYPYYCTEQTMSTALPAVQVGRILKRAGLPQPRDVSTDAIVRNAIARLGALQHPDGSWGWWESDPAHPFMTAYALYGLAEFRKNGFDVPSRMYDNGVDSLVGQLATSNNDTLRFWGGAQPGSEWNTRAFMLYALASAAPKRVDRALLAATHARLGQLNPYALAVLGLADHVLGNDASAHTVLADLDARAVNDGAFTYWRGETWDYAWENDPIETTAYALRLEVALKEDAARIGRVVNFLRTQRQGDWWFTTKDTAAAIYALSVALAPTESEFHPDEIVRVWANGRQVRSLRVTAAVLDAADARVVISAAAMRQGGTISFEREGRGALYWSSDAVRYVPTNAGQVRGADQGVLARLFAAPPPLAVSRSYDVGHSGPWRVGDQVTVRLNVLSQSNVQYVLVEDPFPAGAERQDEQGRAGESSWSGVQLLDDHAAFFADRLYAGQPLTIEYTLRATTPGTYTAPAPTAGAMYGPPVSSIGAATRVEVTP